MNTNPEFIGFCEMTVVSRQKKMSQDLSFRNQADKKFRSQTTVFKTRQVYVMNDMHPC